MKSVLSSKRGAVAAFALVALLLAPVAAGARRAPVWPMDEGSLLVYPQLLRHGEQPHRDFETLYGPGNLWLLGATYSVARPTFGVERTVGLAYRLAIVAAIAVLVWPAGAPVAAGSALVAGIIAFALGLPAFAWLGALALALAGLAGIATALRATGDHLKRWLAGGALLGAAVVFRLDLAFGVAAAALVLLADGRPVERRRLLTGLAVAPIAYAVHVARAGPRAVVRGMVGDVLRQSPGRRLPLPPHRLEVAALLGLAVTGVIALVAAGTWLRRNRQGDGAVVLALGLLCAGTLPQAVQRAEASHVGSAAVACVGLLPLALAHLARLARGSRGRVSALNGVVVVTAAVVVVAALAAPAILHPALGYGERSLGLIRSRSAAVHRDGRWVVVDDRHQAGELRALLHDVDAVSRPGQRVFVGPANLRRTNYNDTFLYALLPELTPASYFLEMNPGSANRRGSRLASDLATADVVVLTTAYDRWSEPNASSRDGPRAPLDVLARHFCVRAEHPPWRLLVRCK